MNKLVRKHLDDKNDIICNYFDFFIFKYIFKNIYLAVLKKNLES